MKGKEMKRIMMLMLVIISSLSLGAGLNALDGKSNINFLGNYEIGDLGLDDNGKTRKEVEIVKYKLAGKVLNEYNVSLKLEELEKKVKNSIKDKSRQDRVLKVVREAYTYLGIRYKWGGNTKSEGVDCSGFVHNSLLKANIETRRVSRLQAKDSEHISYKEATIGDLVFFKTTNIDEVSHIGLYLGDNLFIHASSGYGKVVITQLKGFYKKTFAGFGRMI
jgi:NLP/P60 protein